jgi:phage N-6-adenine-methyltransferase
MNTAVLFSSAKDDWQTPPELFAQLDAEFGFDVDVAANNSNALKDQYLGPDRGRPDRVDALAVSWDYPMNVAGRAVCWCNPPYSRGLQAKFIAKAASEREKGVTTVMLLPARTDTKAFHTYVWNAETHQPREGVEVRFLPGRIKFVGAQHGAPFPSMIVVFRGAEHTA